MIPLAAMILAGASCGSKGDADSEHTLDSGWDSATDTGPDCDDPMSDAEFDASIATARCDFDQQCPDPGYVSYEACMESETLYWTSWVADPCATRACLEAMLAATCETGWEEDAPEECPPEGEWCEEVGQC